MQAESAGIGSDLEKIYKGAGKIAERLEFYGRNDISKTGYEQYESLFKEEQETWEAYQYEQALETLEEIFDRFRREMPDVALVKRFVLDLLLKIYWNYLDEAQRKNCSIDELILITHCKIWIFWKKRLPGMPGNLSWSYRASTRDSSASRM